MYADEVSGWREAVDTVTAPLVEHGAIKPSYVDAIKESIAAPGGTYIDLGWGIALAHARPEAGVVSTSLSVLHVGKPFLLADDEKHPITTMFCLGAVDSNAHIEMMQALAGLLTDEQQRTALEHATTVEQLRAVLD
ncbi:PTS sugar transporter subunit IIA [Bifidobacterium pseudocatenulatum IPLA36007]|jgi:PTS system ascorbate-specific IIA component|nr:PTS sugar transporter subunit IIA [Bifidobacterium pseudocatenulatum IPLA36007]OKY88298.1 MAG: PTS sugar transporter subunit IIA [Bifidobacterium sp. 56_9_plus]